MKGAIAKAEELRSELPNAVTLGQFDNPANPEKHYQTTGEEIWVDTDGKVDAFVAGVGTGGTVSGTGRKLKEHNLAIKVVAVEPADSPMLSAGHAGPHKIQGIGAGFVPKNYNASVIDEVITVSNDEAIGTARLLATRHCNSPNARRCAERLSWYCCPTPVSVTYRPCSTITTNIKLTSIYDFINPRHRFTTYRARQSHTDCGHI